MPELTERELGLGAPHRVLFSMFRVSKWGVVVRSAYTTSPLLIQILPEVSTLQESSGEVLFGIICK